MQTTDEVQKIYIEICVIERRRHATKLMTNI